MKVFVVTVDDFPYGQAGQNSRAHWSLKNEERQRNRAVAKLAAVSVINASARLAPIFPADELLSLSVYGYSPMDDTHRHDCVNLAGMLKGYIDGLTDAGVWDDDSQVIDFRVRQTSGEAVRRDFPVGLIEFVVKRIEI